MRLGRRPRVFGNSSSTNSSTKTSVQENGDDCRDKETSNTAVTSSFGTSRKYMSPLRISLKKKLSTRKDAAVVVPAATTTDDTERKASNQNKQMMTEKQTEKQQFLSTSIPEQLVFQDDAEEVVSLEPPKRETLIHKSPPSSPLQRQDGVTGPPKSLFNPPPEVTIDPHAVPPSPMRDPAISFPLPQRLTEDHRLLLDIGNEREQEWCLGDPLGDIAMKRQLLDAQRLVRLILGKPLCGDQQLLETNTILQAIQSFAMMKQELITLRKRQEEQDGDPPTILETLGSPVASTPASGTSDSPFFFNREAKVEESPISCSLNEARTKIECLEQQLATANDKILKLEKERDLANANAAVAAITTVSTSTSLPSSEDRDSKNEQIEEEKYRNLEAKYQELIKNHEMAVEESKRKLDEVLEEVASVPKKVLAKDSVREKLKTYCKTITSHESQLQFMEMEARMQREREESERRIQELENRLRFQADSHRRQIQKLQASDESIPQADDTKENQVIFQEVTQCNINGERLISSKGTQSTTPMFEIEEEKKIDH